MFGKFEILTLKELLLFVFEHFQKSSVMNLRKTRLNQRLKVDITK